MEQSLHPSSAGNDWDEGDDMSYTGKNKSTYRAARKTARVQLQGKDAVEIAQMQDNLLAYCINHCQRYDACHTIAATSCSRMNAIAESGARKLDKVDLASLVQE